MFKKIRKKILRTKDVEVPTQTNDDVGIVLKRYERTPFVYTEPQTQDLNAFNSHNPTCQAEEVDNRHFISQDKQDDNSPSSPVAVEKQVVVLTKRGTLPIQVETKTENDFSPCTTGKVGETCPQGTSSNLSNGNSISQKCNNEQNINNRLSDAAFPVCTCNAIQGYDNHILNVSEPRQITNTSHARHHSTNSPEGSLPPDKEELLYHRKQLESCSDSTDITNSSSGDFDELIEQEHLDSVSGYATLDDVQRHFNLKCLVIKEAVGRGLQSRTAEQTVDRAPGKHLDEVRKTQTDTRETPYNTDEKLTSSKEKPTQCQCDINRNFQTHGSGESGSDDRVKADHQHLQLIDQHTCKHEHSIEQPQDRKNTVVILEDRCAKQKVHCCQGQSEKEACKDEHDANVYVKPGVTVDQNEAVKVVPDCQTVEKQCKKEIPRPEVADTHEQTVNSDHVGTHVCCRHGQQNHAQTPERIAHTCHVTEIEKSGLRQRQDESLHHNAGSETNGEANHKNNCDSIHHVAYLQPEIKAEFIQPVCLEVPHKSPIVVDKNVPSVEYLYAKVPKSNSSQVSSDKDIGEVRDSGEGFDMASDSDITTTRAEPFSEDIDDDVFDYDDDDDDGYVPPIPSRNYLADDPDKTHTSDKQAQGGVDGVEDNDKIDSRVVALSDRVDSGCDVSSQPDISPGDDSPGRKTGEPTHMSWDEVMLEAKNLGIPLYRRSTSMPGHCRKPSSSSLGSLPRNTHVPFKAVKADFDKTDKKKKPLKEKIANMFAKKSHTWDPKSDSLQIQKRCLPSPPKNPQMTRSLTAGPDLHVHIPSPSPQSSSCSSPSSRNSLSPRITPSPTGRSLQYPPSFQTSTVSVDTCDGGSICSGPSSLLTGSTASMPGSNADFIDSLSKLKDVGWYWGPLGWDDAESKLANKPDGSFLVRDSSDDRYILSLSFRSQNRTHHTRIEHYKGTFSFYSQPKSHGAATIVDFIVKAMEHSRSGKFLYFLRPRAPGLPPAPIQLLYPLSRFRHMPTLQHLCRFTIVKHTRKDLIDQLPVPPKVKGYLKQSQYYTEHLGHDHGSI